MDYMGTSGIGTDPAKTFMPAGQGSGLIHQIKPAAEVMTDLIRETEEAITKLSRAISPARPEAAAATAD